MPVASSGMAILHSLTSHLQLPYDSRYSSDTKDLLSEAVLNSYELKDNNPEEFTSGEEQH